MTASPCLLFQVCYNQQQTEVNLGVVTNTFMQEVEGSDNVTQVCCLGAGVGQERALEHRELQLR